MSRFLWRGSKEEAKMHWVSWDRVCRSKKYGGLGLSKLRICNVVLLAKWGWRFKNNRDSVWCKVVEAFYFSIRS